MDGFRLDFRVGDGWIQTGLQSWRWMDLDWSLDLSLDWIQTEIGQGNSRSKQYQNQAASWKEGGEGEEGKRDLFFYTFLLERLDDEDEEDD